MKYVIGLDFGTLSARAAVVSLEDGKIAGQAVSEYKSGVITDNLPSFYALENPDDILSALQISVKNAMKESKVNPLSVVGIGLDTTSYSMVCCDCDGNPMFHKAQFKNEPMAYIRLWKHHAAQNQADRIENLHRKTGLLPQLDYFGGKVSSEFALPKILETYEKAPELFEQTYRFCDLGEWLVWKLTGKPVYSLFTNSFKSFYTDRHGFPSKEFLNMLEHGFGEKVSAKLYGTFADEQQSCGILCRESTNVISVASGFE